MESSAHTMNPAVLSTQGTEHHTFTNPVRNANAKVSARQIAAGRRNAFARFFVEQFAVFDVFVGDEFVYRDAEEGRELFQTVYAGETAVVFPFGHRRTRDVKFVGKFLLRDVVLSPEFFEFFAECHIRLLRDNHTSAAPKCHDTFRHVAQKYAKALLYSARKKVKITV